ncbi:MAG: signal peptidase II [Marinibacterium sp.]|nr:signal peptidase II [Marinibacterium sp.]
MRVLWISALLAFAADQLSKGLVVYGMDLISLRQIPVWPPYLVFRYGENTGINFGLFSGDTDAARWILVGLSLVICAGLLLWLRRSARDWRVLGAAGLLIGGALGNVYDRVIYGYVLDFLNMSCCGISNPYVFNLADVFIFAGAIGLVLWDGASSDAAKKGT